MVIKVIRCYHCGSTEITKNGKAPNGKQKYHCKDCETGSRENPDHGYTEEEKETILKAYQERSSMRGISRTFGVSRNTLTKWIKKSQDIATDKRNFSSAKRAS